MINRSLLKEIITDSDSKSGKTFAILIQILIVISIISFSIETTPNLNGTTIKILNFIEIFCVVVFTIEYFLRIFFAEKKLQFIFSFFGLIDLFAILPFYLAFGVDLRSLRALRFLRLFRILKIVRYNRAISHFTKAIRYAREEILLFLFVTMILIYLAAVGIYYFENAAQPDKFSSIFDSLWWAVITLTTVGYGDVYPITIGGKIFTFIILLIGLGIVAIPTGIISSALTKSIDEKVEKEKEV